MAASHKEIDIIREAGDLFMIRVAAGVYEVYLSGATHAVRKAWVSFKSDDKRALIKAHEVFERIAQQSAIDTGPMGPQGPSGISKRIVTLSGTTDANGNVSFTFSPVFAATPHISAMLVATNTRQYTRITAASATGCTVNAYQQNQTLLSLLGLDILTAQVTAMASATIRIMATEM